MARLFEEGVVAPTTAPTKKGRFYIDTVLGDLYTSLGTSGVGDWLLVAGNSIVDAYVGMTDFKINFRNVANSFTSFFTNSNTAVRTYTFPDATGTVALISDITSTATVLTTIASRVFGKVTQSDTTETYLQPVFWGKSIVWWQPSIINTTLLTATGSSFASVGSGTGGLTTFNTSSRFGRVAKTSFVTGATPNVGVTGFYETASPVGTGGTRTIGAVGGLGGFFSVFSFCLGGIMGGKFYMGMLSVSPPTNVEPDTLTNCILIGCKTGETNLSIYYGGTSIQTPINLGANFPTVASDTDIYTITLHAKRGTGSVFYKIERVNTGGVVTGELTAATAGIQLPSNTTNLKHQGYCVNHPTLTGVTNLHHLGFYSEAEF